MIRLKIYCKDEDCRPHRAHPTDAGIDLKADKNYTIAYHKATKVKTGIHVQIPRGYVGLIVPRSSIGLLGLELANTVGVIDSDYRGEVICAFRTAEMGQVTSISKGERIAQLVVVPCLTEETYVDELEDLTRTIRGEGGFGHTGKR